MAVKIDVDACVGCELCLPTCPVSALSMNSEGKAVVADSCFDCGACLGSCPVTAITL